MKKNMSTLDKTIRIVFAVLVTVLFVTNVISGILGYVLLAAGGILLTTTFINFCPLYAIFGISTCKVN